MQLESAVNADPFQGGGDGGIVGGSRGKRFLCQAPLGSLRKLSAVRGQLIGDSIVIGGRGDHGNVLKIFGG